MRLFFYFAWLIFCIVIGYIIFTLVKKNQPKYNPPLHPEDRDDDEGELMTDDEEKKAYQQWQAQVEENE